MFLGYVLQHLFSISIKEMPAFVIFLSILALCKWSTYCRSKNVSQNIERET